MLVPVRNMAGETVEEIELREDIFGIEPNVAVMHQALVRQLANARLGTHKAKGRSEVSGGGRKPWRQKGTGRARQGSIRAPQWKGGGTVHGPQPRSYAQKLPKKMRRLALRSALSTKVAEEQLILVDQFDLPQPKTKEMVAVLDQLQMDSDALVLMPEANENVELSARNLQYVKIARANLLSVRDLLMYDYVIMPVESIAVIERTLGMAE